MIRLEEAPWTWWRLGYVVAAVVGGGLVEPAIQAAIGPLAFRGGVARTMQVQTDRIVTTFGIYPLTIFGPQGLLFLCFIFPFGFVAYLPTTALLGRVAEVPLPARLVWVSPWRAGCCSPPVAGAVLPHVAALPEPGDVTRSSVTQVPTRRGPPSSFPTGVSRGIAA